MQNMDDVIRERAYHMWTEAGCPEGNADAFWLGAQREILAASMTISAGAKPAAAKKTTKAKVASPRKRKAA